MCTNIYIFVQSILYRHHHTLVLSFQMSLFILTPMLLKLEYLASWNRTETGGRCVFHGFGLIPMKHVAVCSHFFSFFNRYDKREDMSPTNPEIKMYSHLLMEANVTKIRLLQDTHQPLAFIEGYSNTGFHMFHFPPVSVRLERKTVLMERRTESWQQKDHIQQE